MDKKKIIIAIVSVVAVIAIAIIASLLPKDTKTMYTISFDTDGGNQVVSQQVEEGKKVTKPANPTKEGYEFLGWYSDGTYFDFETPVEKDLKLEARWKEIIVDDDTQIEDNENKEDEKVEEDKDDKKEETTTKVTKYTVKFETDGGSKVASKTVEKNKTVKAPIDPTKDGYIFKGWYLGSTKYDFSKKVTKNITLTAKWEKIEEQKPVEPDTPEEPGKPEKPEVKSYIVTFKSEGGSKVDNQTIEENKTATKPADPKKDGYTFKGWYLNGKEFDFSTKITSDITLTAKWEKNPEPEVLIEDVKDSLPAQVRIFITLNGKKVAGTATLVSKSGKTATIEIPSTGYLRPKGTYEKIINPEVK